MPLRRVPAAARQATLDDLKRDYPQLVEGIRESRRPN